MKIPKGWYLKPILQRNKKEPTFSEGANASKGQLPPKREEAKKEPTPAKDNGDALLANEIVILIIKKGATPVKDHGDALFN